jgi:glycosyltransferase involved in cell wall biosynthesis
MDRPKVVFLVNGVTGSAMDVRARSFSARLSDGFHVQIAYRTANKVAATFRFLGVLLRVRPELCYVFDMAFSGVLAAGFFQFVFRCPMIIDTGDAIYELSKNSGRRGASLWLTWLLEKFALAAAHRIVVRSHLHQELLQRSNRTAAVIPDGVDLSQFKPGKEDALRRKYNLDNCTVIGLLGNLIWNPRSQMCYGSDLIEVIDQLRDRSVKGLIIGDGSGLARLETECAARGLQDRILFVGRISYNDLPPYINLMDICLSTQTNDIAGNVRTTGKLPLYLACGRFVLSTNVGEASRVLPPEMLVPYEGSKDSAYPSRLAARVEWFLANQGTLQQETRSTSIAKTYFDYNLLAARMAQLFVECRPTTSKLRKRAPVLALPRSASKDDNAFHG